MHLLGHLYDTLTAHAVKVFIQTIGEADETEYLGAHAHVSELSETYFSIDLDQKRKRDGRLSARK